MDAKQIKRLPQEGTSYAGESLPEPSSSGCPSYSGGGNVLPEVDLVEEMTEETEKGVEGRNDKPNTKTTLVQQTFHRSMFIKTRPNPPKTAEWQKDKTPVNKRKLIDTSPTQLENPSKKTQNTGTTNNITYKVPTQNQFDILNKEIGNTKEEETKPPKPEPIFVTGVNNIAQLKEILNKITTNEEYTIATLRSGHIVKIMPASTDSYKTIRQHFILENVAHYTYQLKSERAFRVVLRGIHPSEDISNIKMEIEKLGHDVRQVVKVLHRVSKEPLPMFYVDLEPKFNNKDIYKTKQLNYMRVTFEPPYKKKEILQCKRCQRFGHTKNQCFRPFRCVKCGEDHSTVSCTKSPNTDATCANCNEKHPASYKGCSKYKQYRDQILKINEKPKSNRANKIIETTIDKPNMQDNRKQHLRSNITQQPKWTPAHHTPSLQVNNSDSDPQEHRWRNEYDEILKYDQDRRKTTPIRQGKTFAEATKRKQNHNEKPTDSSFLGTNDLEVIMDKMFNRFEIIMTNMMDKMMDRMIQLISSLLTK